MSDSCLENSRTNKGMFLSFSSDSLGSCENFGLGYTPKTTTAKTYCVPVLWEFIGQGSFSPEYKPVIRRNLKQNNLRLSVT